MSSVSVGIILLAPMKKNFTDSRHSNWISHPQVKHSIPKTMRAWLPRVSACSRLKLNAKRPRPPHPHPGPRRRTCCRRRAHSRAAYPCRAPVYPNPKSYAPDAGNPSLEPHWPVAPSSQKENSVTPRPDPLRSNSSLGPQFRPCYSH